MLYALAFSGGSTLISLILCGAGGYTLATANITALLAGLSMAISLYRLYALWRLIFNHDKRDDGGVTVEALVDACVAYLLAWTMVFYVWMVWVAAMHDHSQYFTGITLPYDGALALWCQMFHVTVMTLAGIGFGEYIPLQVPFQTVVTFFSGSGWVMTITLVSAGLTFVLNGPGDASSKRRGRRGLFGELELG